MVLFGAHGVPYRAPPRELVDEIRGRGHISSVQITFDESVPMEQHAMPPGGFRLAVVNCLDLDTGLRAREDLALSFWSAQPLGAGRVA